MWYHWLSNTAFPSNIFINVWVLFWCIAFLCKLLHNQKLQKRMDWQLFSYTGGQVDRKENECMGRWNSIDTRNKSGVWLLRLVGKKIKKQTPSKQHLGFKYSLLVICSMNYQKVICWHWTWCKGQDLSEQKCSLLLSDCLACITFRPFSPFRPSYLENQSVQPSGIFCAVHLFDFFQTQLFLLSLVRFHLYGWQSSYMQKCLSSIYLSFLICFVTVNLSVRKVEWQHHLLK